MAATNERPVASVSTHDDRSTADLDHIWETVERVRARNADKSPEEVLADVTAEVEAVRQERYERREAAKKNGR